MSFDGETLGPGMRCIKYLIVAFNAIFITTGILIIAVGTTAHSLYYEIDEFLEAKYFSPATLLIVVGALVFFIAIFGYLGALKESTCMINFYAVFLGIIFLLEISAGIAAFVYRGDIGEAVEDKMKDSLNLYYNNSDIRDTIDTIQNDLHCCGVDDPEDWKDIYPSKNNEVSFNFNTTIILPNSCCGEWSNKRSCRNIHKYGCNYRLSSILRRSIALLSGSALIVSVIQIIGMYFSFSLARAIRRTKSERLRQDYEIRTNPPNENSVFGFPQNTRNFKADDVQQNT